MHMAQTFSQGWDIAKFEGKEWEWGETALSMIYLPYFLSLWVMSSG